MSPAKLSETDLLHLLRIDLGLRSEFEAALRQKLLEYRRAPNPELTKVELTVTLNLGEGIAEDRDEQSFANVRTVLDGGPNEGRP